MALPPERRSLADRIAKLARLRRERDTLDAASTPASEARFAAQAALDRAREAIGTTARASIDHRIAVLAGQGEDAPPPSVEQARQRVREAEDALAATTAARGEIERRQRAVRQALPGAERDVENAARTVLWFEMLPRLDQVVGEARAAQRAYLEAAARAQFILDCTGRMVPDHSPEAEELRSVAQEIETLPVAWRVARGGPHATERLKSSLDALMRDPAAKLPR